MRRNELSLQTKGGVLIIEFTLKQAMCANPNTVTCTQNLYK